MVHNLPAPALPKRFNIMNPSIRLAAGVWAILAVVLSSAGAPPQIAKISAPTLQSGGVTTLIFDGTDLGPNPRVLLPVAIAEQKVKEGGTAAKVQIDVKLDASVPPGVYQLRLASDKGISNPINVEIDPMPQQAFAPKVEKLPACLQGALGGSATLSTTLAGKKGQRLVIEVEARRLGSAIDPVVKLFDPQRVQLAWGRGSNPLGGDARIVSVLPADGTYTIELHDAQYKAGTPNRFRMRIGDLQFVDLPFPLAGQRGTKASFQLIGSLPEATKVEADLTNAPGGSMVRLPLPANAVGLAPSVLVSEIPEVLENEAAAGKLQELAIPSAVNGRLRQPKEEDKYRLAVQPGMKLKLDVLAERAGSPLDGVLILRNEAGTQLARSDDQATTLDPSLEYTVPDGVTALIAAVSDLRGRGGPDFVYRLAVTPAALPDFSLAIVEDRPHVPRTGAAILRIRATRSNYNGPIKLTLPGLPAGVAVTGDEIPAGATEALLSLTAPEGAPLGQAVVRVIGESTEPGVSLKRLALPPETAFTKAQPSFRGELGVAVTEPAPLGIVWEGDHANLPLGGNIVAKVKVGRTPESMGPIRLSLVTSQIAPKTKDNKDDVGRTLRLETAPTLTADQATADLKILVPADLPAMPYDLAIRAELLGKDPKTVLQTAVTPVRRLAGAK